MNSVGILFQFYVLDDFNNKKPYGWYIHPFFKKQNKLNTGLFRNIKIYKQPVGGGELIDSMIKFSINYSKLDGEGYQA